jgi:hypothetical protein
MAQSEAGGSELMAPEHELVFLFDVDETLFDNDRLKADLGRQVEESFGPAAAKRFWAIYEEERERHVYADPIGTLERFRLENLGDPRAVKLALWLMDYPFADRLFPDALAVVGHVRKWGLPVILTDGDGVFQPYKLSRSGLLRAFDDHALTYIHKEKELDGIEQAYPARHYVVIDDKLSVLQAMKTSWGERVTTIFVKQGHYARDAGDSCGRAPDLAIDRISELMLKEFSALAPV